MFNTISKEELEQLRKDYPIGATVKLVSMDDEFAPPIGSLGLVQNIDDVGTIHISWHCGSSLGIVFGVDKCVVVKS